MRVKIEYYNDRNGSKATPFWAKSEINGELVCTCGTDWNEVRKTHLGRLSDMVIVPEPPIAEEVDL